MNIITLIGHITIVLLLMFIVFVLTGRILVYYEFFSGFGLGMMFPLVEISFIISLIVPVLYSLNVFRKFKIVKKNEKE